ncbi:MAG TPA: hypothetical protein DCE44_05780, partial [Verrucomicrobiales bacterium]|nr:hypothetical protein [Verrucomicrobiales bacterium]
LFEQIRAHQNRTTALMPTGREVMAYVHDLWQATEPPGSKERLQVEQMKRYLNFIGQGVGPDAATAAEFLYRIRRTTTRQDFFDVCRAFLDHGDPMSLRPFSNVAAARNEVPSGG